MTRSSGRSRPPRPIAAEQSRASAVDSSYRAFADRFGLSIDSSYCQAWFVNWIRNHLLGERSFHAASEDVAFGLASRLGVRYKTITALERFVRTNDEPKPSFTDYIPDEFLPMLYALQFLHAAMPDARTRLNSIVEEGLRDAPCDLQIRWRDGQFRPSGAQLLDESVVMPALAYLIDAGLRGAAEPLERALHALLEGKAKPTRYKDSVRDAYEALEYTAKLVTGRDRDLSANRDSFAGRANLGPTTSALLREYIEFGNQYRHADSLQGLPAVDVSRAELFIYETALILRAAQPAAEEAMKSRVRDDA